MQQRIFNALLIAAMLLAMVAVIPAGAAPAIDDGAPSQPGEAPAGDEVQELGPIKKPKAIDWPNPIEYKRSLERMRLLQEGNTAEASALAKTGTTNVLVLLVEFAGTDTFTWSPGDEWDPLGIADPNEFTGTLGDCSNIITQTQTFTYTGPLHNQIPQPLSAEDPSGTSIWTPDFSKQWFEDFMFGQGVTISYTRQDGSEVYEDFTGKSVTNFYADMSGGKFEVTGDVVGWLTLDHSTWYYDADECPGARSTSLRPQRGGMIPGAGTTRDLVYDALDKVNEMKTNGDLPDFDWADYDGNGDGIIDSLWIVHAGYGEEDNPTLMNRTDYGEAAVWSHSSSTTPYLVDADQNISAQSYIMMPESGGMAVFAHEFGHNIGSIDLYSYGDGETSAGMWTLMSDSWVGYPLGFGINSFDPWHMDAFWGWLDDTNMKVISDTNQVYEFTLGQASDTPEGAYRAAKIELPLGEAPLAVAPWSGMYWWGGKGDLSNGTMTTANAISIPVTATTATLSFEMAYGIEDEWDFLWIQASTDGTNWDTLTNANTQCVHDPSWIGETYGFPADLCGAGIGGFYGHNASFPSPDTETFDLSAYAGQDVYLRFWYMTDWGTTYEGPFVDNVSVSVDGSEIFADGAEEDTGAWEYEFPWQVSDGNLKFNHNYYLQWRNTGPNGGYDSSLGDERYRFGPAETGLVTWYNNNYYGDNEIYAYMEDFPSIGPKGAMMVIDSQPDPYRDPNSEFLFDDGFENERANVTNRAMVRDAPFILKDYTSDIQINPSYVISPTLFEGREGQKTFHDALGYYPGVEFTKLGSTSTTRYYVTRDWDSSTVVPAKKAYSLKGPADYPAGASLPNIIWRYNPGTEGWYLLTGDAADVGSGNPGDEMVQYGWHVEVVEQAADNTWAKVRVWNSMYALDTKVTSDTPSADLGETVEYDVQLKNAGSKSSFMVCIPFDSNVEYVADSASPGALFLESCPSGAAAWGDVASAAEPNAIGWVINDLPTEAETYFNFSVEVKSVMDPNLGMEVMAYTPAGEIYTSLTTDLVDLPYHSVLLPLLQK